MTGKFPKPVTATLVLTSAFWLFMLWQQSVFVLKTIQSPPEHPIVARFAQRYIVTSSAQLAAFLLGVAVFGGLLYIRRASWAAAALALISLLAVWRYFFAGMGVLFRPPLGDGTIRGAVLAQLGLASERWFAASVETFVPLALAALWAVCSYRLHANKKPLTKPLSEQS